MSMCISILWILFFLSIYRILNLESSNFDWKLAVRKMLGLLRAAGNAAALLDRHSLCCCNWHHGSDRVSSPEN